MATERVAAVGGVGGNKEWDDGSDHDAVTRIFVESDDNGIKSVHFNYVIKGRRQYPSNPDAPLRPSEFEIAHPGGFLTSVEGWYDAGSNVIQGIQFKGKTIDTPMIGKEIPDGGVDTRFTLQVQGKKIIGFHGKSSDDHLTSIGAYVTPIVSPVGEDGGTPWDDGADFDGVRNVSVSQGDDGITVVKFVYGKDDDETIPGPERGNMQMGMFEEFALDYPDEYITSVNGTYDKILGSEAVVINMLRFKTNKRESDPFGLNAGTPFDLGEDGYKIVGFNGNTGGEYLHKIGVHVLPIA